MWGRWRLPVRSRGRRSRATPARGARERPRPDRVARPEGPPGRSPWAPPPAGVPGGAGEPVAQSGIDRQDALEVARWLRSPSHGDKVEEPDQEPRSALAPLAPDVAEATEPGHEAIVADPEGSPLGPRRMPVASTTRTPGWPSAKRAYHSSTSRVTKPSAVWCQGTVAEPSSARLPPSPRGTGGARTSAFAAPGLASASARGAGRGAHGRWRRGRRGRRKAHDPRILRPGWRPGAGSRAPRRAARGWPKAAAAPRTTVGQAADRVTGSRDPSIVQGPAMVR